MLTPANNATGVSQSPSIQVQFSQPVKNVVESTVSLHEGSVSGATVAIGNITAGSNNTYTFSPSTNLSSQTSDYVVLSTDITDVNGNHMAAAGQFSFTVGDFNPPTVGIVTPANNATNVAQTPSIQVQFSEAVLNVNSSNVTIHAGSPTGDTVAIGNITAGSNNTYSFSPTTSLASETLYYVVLGTGITDLAGNHLVDAAQFSFTIGDFNPPSVSIVTPSNNATNVAQTPSIQVQFNESVNNVTSTNVTLHLGSATGPTIAIGNLTLGSNNTYSFSPSASLAGETLYYVVLGSGITDVYGTALTQTEFSFTTGDFNPPSVSIVTPSNNATGVAQTPSIQVQFNQAVNNVNSTNVTLHSGSATGPTVMISHLTLGSNNTYSFSPLESLSSVTLYYVVLGSGITDVYGTALTQTEFSFTTGDFNPPSVSIVTPSNNATNVAQTPSIQVQFNQAVNNVNSTNVTLHSGSATGPTVAIGNLTLGSNNTYSFSPSASLAGETLYYVVLGSGITDVYGTALTQTQFSFTTGDFNPPSVSIVTPSNNATGVAQTPSIQVQFNQVVNNVNSTNVTLHSGSATGATVAIGNLTLGSNNTYSFSPSASLASVTTYYVVLGSGITNGNGTALTQTQFSFTTGDFNPPTVSLITPSNNATNVSQSPIIQIQFNESVNNVNTTNVTLHTGSAGGPTVAIGTITPGTSNTYTFSPSSSLASVTTYYVVLGSGITNVYGTALTMTPFSFTTGDFNPPTVSLVSPSNNATGVIITPTIRLSFSEHVIGVNSSTVTLHTGSPTGTVVAIGNITESGNNYSFSPVFTLSESTTYYVVLSSAITDLYATPLTGMMQFSFTTKTVYAYVANIGNNAVTQCQVAANGNLSSCVNTGVTVAGIRSITMNNGYAYLLSNTLNTVTKCAVSVSGTFSGCVDSGATRISTAYDMSISGGYAYIPNYSGTYGNTITQCTVSNTDGSLSSCVTIAAPLLTAPRGITVSNGFLYTTNIGSDLVNACVIGSNGSLSNCATSGTMFSNSAGIAVYNGFSYVLNGSGTYANTATQCTVNSSTGALSSCVNSGATTLSTPNRLTFYTGYIYMTNGASNTVTKCTVNSSTGALSSCVNSGATIISQPSGIAIY